MEEKGSCSNHRDFSCLSLLSSNPVFSCLVSVYVLIILYFPPALLKVVSWPVLLSTAVLLLTLLRIGAKQISEKQSISTGKLSISEGENLLLTEKLDFTATDGFRSSFQELSCSAFSQNRSSEKQNVSSGVLSISLLEQSISTQEHGVSMEEPCIYILKQSISSEKKGLSSEEHSIFSDEKSVPSEEQIISAEEESISSQDDNWVWSKTGKQPEPTPGFNPLFVDSFLEWDVRAPLEVIYEESEEEKEENENRAMKFHSSLSLYYPESDTETSSSDGDFPVIGNWDTPENINFRWEEEEEDEKGLIEIALDGKKSLLAQELQRTGEEENMIEIDIFPARLCCVSPVSLSSNSD